MIGGSLPIGGVSATLTVGPGSHSGRKQLVSSNMTRANGAPNRKLQSGIVAAQTVGLVAIPCRDFARGTCKRGKCRFLHSIPTSSSHPVVASTVVASAPRNAWVRPLPRSAASPSSPLSGVAVVVSPSLPRLAANASPTTLHKDWPALRLPQPMSVAGAMYAAYAGHAKEAVVSSEVAARVALHCEQLQCSFTLFAQLRSNIERTSTAAFAVRCPMCSFTSPWALEVGDHVRRDHLHQALQALDHTASDAYSGIMVANAASARILLRERSRLLRLAASEAALVVADLTAGGWLPSPAPPAPLPTAGAQVPLVPAAGAQAPSLPAAGDQAPPLPAVAVQAPPDTGLNRVRDGSLLRVRRRQSTKVGSEGLRSARTPAQVAQLRAVKDKSRAEKRAFDVSDGERSGSDEDTMPLSPRDRMMKSVQSHSFFLPGMPSADHQDGDDRGSARTCGDSIVDGNVGHAPFTPCVGINVGSHVNGEDRGGPRSCGDSITTGTNGHAADIPVGSHVNGEDRGGPRSCGDSITTGTNGHAMVRPGMTTRSQLRTTVAPAPALAASSTGPAPPVFRAVAPLVDTESSDPDSARSESSDVADSDDSIDVLASSSDSGHEGSDDDDILLGSLHPVVVPEASAVQHGLVRARVPVLNTYASRRDIHQYSWYYVALLASAFDRPGHQSARAVSALSVPRFAEVVQLIADSGFVVSRFISNQGQPYVAAREQERLQDFMTGCDLFNLAQHAALDAPVLPEVLRAALPVAGCTVLADTSGAVYTVTVIHNGFATLLSPSGVSFARIPVSALVVVDGGAACSNEGFIAFASQRSFARSASRRAAAVPALCTCPGRASNVQGRHMNLCPVSRQARARPPLNPPQGRRLCDAEGPSALSGEVPPVAPDEAARPAAIEEPDLPPLVMPQFQEVAALRCTIIERIPRDAADAVSAAFTWTVDRLRRDDAWTWLRLYAFSKCILARPPRGTTGLSKLIRARCLRWRQSDGWIALWNEVSARRPSSRSGPSTQRFSIDTELEEMFKHCPDLGSTLVDADTLPADVVNRAINLARRGFLSRASSALAAVATAAETPASVDEMRQKHPVAPPPQPSPEIIAQAAAQEIEPFGRKSILRALRSFPLGSTPGCSGLSIDHLLSITTANTANFATLPNLLMKFAKGQLPPEAVSYFCGARLVALVKKDGDLRPIAVGDSLRRLTARLLLRQCKGPVAAYLAERHQVGVGVPGGLEATCHTARRVRHSWAQAGVTGRAFLKLDFSNAFNRLAREPLLEQTAKVVPLLLPFVLMLYVVATVLLFGTTVILSLLGVQQGDPLGPPLYAITFAFLWELVLAEVRRRLGVGPDGLPFTGPLLDFAAWYLDDGTLGSTFAVLRLFYDCLTEMGPAYGIHLNPAKCELVTSVEDAAEGLAMFPELPPAKHHTFSDWFLLGSPMGDDLAAHYAATVARAERKSKLLGRLVEDPHVAICMLTFCGAFSLLVHLLRACGPGPSDDLRRYDALVQDVATNITSVISPWLSVPLRLGGGGLRSTADHAHVAFIASVSASASIANIFVPVSFALAPDPRLLEVVDMLRSAPLPTSAAAEAVGEYLANALPVDGPCTASFRDKQQKKWSVLIDEAAAAVLEEGLPEPDIARIRSVSDDGASAYLCLPIDDRSTFIHWLLPAEFNVVYRFRYGLSLHPGLPGPCTLCKGLHVADVHGRHSTKCMRGGARMMTHHAIRNWVYCIASSAQLAPQLEVSVFSSQPHSRLDINIRISREIVDTAFISVFAAEHTRRAADTSGGACEHYMGKKVGSYGAAARLERLTLIAFVVDCFGATSSHVRPLISRLVHIRAHRSNASFASALAATHRDFSVMVQRRVAALLLANATTLEPSGLQAPVMASAAASVDGSASEHSHEGRMVAAS